MRTTRDRGGDGGIKRRGGENLFQTIFDQDASALTNGETFIKDRKLTV